VTGPDVAALALLVGEDLEAVVASLPVDERHAIVLAYFGGHTYREAAELLGEPEAVVRQWIRSGLARLRAQLPTPPGSVRGVRANGRGVRSGGRAGSG
jgi:RNA polymerase sigma factor (sigma-70 family)